MPFISELTFELEPYLVTRVSGVALLICTLVARSPRSPQPQPTIDLASHPDILRRRNGVTARMAVGQDDRLFEQLRHVIGSDSFVDGISWSPDGTGIAFSAATSYPQGRACPLQIWMANIDGTNARNLTNLGGHDCGAGVRGRPSWSPDGTQIVFSITKRDTSQVYLINADGTGMRQVTFKGNNCCPTWAR